MTIIPWYCIPRLVLKKYYANNSDDTIKEIIMKFVDDINIEKTNRHFYDDNDSRRYYEPVDLIAFDIIKNLTVCKYSFLWTLRIER